MESVEVKLRGAGINGYIEAVVVEYKTLVLLFQRC